MPQNNRFDIYKCEECGNIVEILHSSTGPLTCCGVAMKYVKAGVVEASKEKHVPVVEKTDKGYKVTVGSVIHPMEDKHYIEWIELIVNDKIIDRVYLAPGEQPIANFETTATGKVYAREYCNLHGLWQKDL